MEGESKFTSLLFDQKSQVASKTSNLQGELVRRLAEQEFEELVAIMLSVVGKAKLAANEYNKLNHPDVKTYTTDGTEVAVFSAERHKQRKEAKDKLDKYTKAIDLALEKGDYSKVKELAK